MINKIIRNFVAKQMAGRADDGIMITLKDPQRVTLAENIMADLLIRNGIDPRAITSEKELKLFLQQIEAMTKQSTTSGIRNTESAKIFEIATGKEIPKGSKIMGGQAADDVPPPGSRGGPDDIAAPVQSSEESLRDMIVAENKKNINKIKQRQKMLNEAIDNQSPGLTGDRKYDADIVAEDLAERMGLVYDDMPTKERLKLYDEAYQALTKKKFDPPEDLATGGRVGLKSGSILESLGFTSEHSAAVADMDKDFSGSQFDYAAASTKDMVDRASNPVTAAISAAGNVVARPVYDFVDAAKEYSKKGYQGEFSFTPQGIVDFGKNLASLGKEFVAQKPLTMMTGAAKGGLEGVIDRFTTKETPIDPTSRNLFTQYYEDDPYAGIAGQTALLDPFTVIGGLVKVAKGAKAKTLAKEFFRNKAKQKVGKEIYDKIQKKINTPKYPQTTTKPGTGGGGGPPGTGTTKPGTGGGGSPYGGGSGGIHSGMKSSSAPTNVGNPFGYMDGGRIGLKDGMNRRTFLKLLGGMAAIPIVGKIFKPFKVGKTVTKVPIIKTDNVPGKPEWFDQLVNKVILEGDDVTKRFATGERQSIHQKTLDDGSVVRVTEDVDDGAVRVEYESEANVYGDPIQMQYKKPKPDEGDPRPSAEFDTAESGPVGRSFGPDDYEIEIDEIGGTSISDLTSDVSKLKEYATGKKPTMKEFIQNKKRKDKARKISEGDREAEMDEVVKRQGEFIQFDDLDPGDFASGGIARMLGE